MLSAVTACRPSGLSGIWLMTARTTLRNLPSPLRPLCRRQRADGGSLLWACRLCHIPEQRSTTPLRGALVCYACRYLFSTGFLDGLVWLGRESRRTFLSTIIRSEVYSGPVRPRSDAGQGLLLIRVRSNGYRRAEPESSPQPYGRLDGFRWVYEGGGNTQDKKCQIGVLQR